MSNATAVTLGDMVRLVFKGWPEGHYKTGQPLRLSWNNRTVTLMPGQEAHVSFELAKTYFGDPRSVDGVIRIKDDYGNDMIVPDRVAEIIRLKSYWQDSSFRTSNAKFREYIPGDRSWLEADGGVISDLIPLVEIYALNGDRIYTVVDDPFGDHSIVSTQTRHEQELYRTQLLEQSDVIMELKKQNKLLMEKLGIDPDMLSKEIEPVKQESVDTAPTVATKKETPRMVYNPRTKRVIPAKKSIPSDDPTSIHDLPPDTD